MAMPEPITDISDEKTVDIIIVGAGITGLAAARRSQGGRKCHRH